jgi:hypothetical protein
LTLPVTATGPYTPPVSSSTVSYVPPSTAPTLPPTTTPITGPGSTTTLPPGNTLPPSGSTYGYDTTGSATSPSGNTEYPGQTSIAVTQASCTSGQSGEQQSWQSDPSSTQSFVECLVSGGFDIQSFTSTGSLYPDQTFDCVNAFVPISYGSPNQQYHWACSSTTGGASTAAVTVTLDSRQSTNVGGEVVPTTKVTFATTFSGAQTGTATTSLVLTDNSIIVNATGNENLSLGSGSYTANFTLGLTSLTPSG